MIALSASNIFFDRTCPDPILLPAQTIFSVYSIRGISWVCLGLAPCGSTYQKRCLHIVRDACSRHIRGSNRVILGVDLVASAQKDFFCNHFRAHIALVCALHQVAPQWRGFFSWLFSDFFVIIFSGICFLTLSHFCFCRFPID